MAQQTTPHTESQQNRTPDRTDLEPDQQEQTAGTDRDADLYANNAGAETGTNRAPERFPDTRPNANTEQAPAAFEGPLSTRTPGGDGQGITSHSAGEESTRQQKVVKDRPDAQAGVNQNRK